MPLYQSVLGVVVLMILCAAGCSHRDPGGRQEISGTVLFGGGPLPRGSIEFHPVAGRGVMSGTVISEGYFRMEAAQGLPPGEYIVRIFAGDENAVEEETPGDSSRMVARQLIPPQFNSQSRQQASVVAGSKNVFDFAIPAGTP